MRAGEKRRLRGAEGCGQAQGRHGPRHGPPESVTSEWSWALHLRDAIQAE